jgi:predicted acylesterase/phospholipase RssA
MEEDNNTKKQHIKELVFGGGHMIAIFHYLGALIELEKYDTIDLSKVTRFLGSSAGAILAFLLTIDLNPKEILNVLIKIPYEKLGETNSRDYLYLFDDLGITDPLLFKKIFNIALEYKNLPTNITFKQLNNILKKDLTIISFCINSKDVKVLNHVFTPNLEVTHALCMTVAIPLLFKPVSYENRLYVDPCITCNFPIDFITNYDDFLGFTTDKTKIYEEDIGFKKYLKILWSSIGNEFLELKRINCHNPERLFIFKSPHEFKGFNITEDDIHSYINTGKIQIKEHVDHLLTVIKSKY